MATEQVIEERVLSIYEDHKELMAEQVFPLYEEKYDETSRSNSIHTTISRLTKKGLLFIVRRDVSPVTKKTVNIWHIADGTPVPQVDAIRKPSNSELSHETELLRLKNKNLEETNMKLLGIIERLREDNDKFQNEVFALETEVSALEAEKAGVDL